MILVPIPASTRAAVEAALRDTRRPIRAIAAETGVGESTIRTWNRRHGWRPAMATRFDPTRWKAPRRLAVARLYGLPWLDIGDLAQAMGMPRHRAEAMFALCGLEGRRPGEAMGATGLDTDPRRLRAALRAHIARQILRFDVALNAEAEHGDGKSFDSARVLRDLGGLKRLLDEADADERAETGLPGTNSGTGARDGTAFGGASGSGGAGGGPPADDLPALRAEIARRAAAFRGERPDSGPAGEPAAAPDPGPGD
ncbi:hypothetical protein [Methylobacterium sp. J-068]|uniref:hypothetical protein n=1 Tax=Methylobacterium sp. J-068 TaxID=2836649 RepID=UPI001FBBD01A|nr:hypothetical protein [Methylobacterium sp. J-068]MCJ2033148.1 hypothetical protein [Methylobacterium sp. J-068]